MMLDDARHQKSTEISKGHEKENGKPIFATSTLAPLTVTKQEKVKRVTDFMRKMRLKLNHTQQSSPTGTPWQSFLLCHRQRGSSSKLYSLTSTKAMEQRTSKPSRFQMFLLRERWRMAAGQAAGHGLADGQADGTEARLRELALTWFTETQAPLLLHNGNFPAWFQGSISRKDAEDHLRDKDLGCFLIRLSDKAAGYILSYKGRDRCRHFVITQNKVCQFIVTGDTETHDTLTSLIEYYKTKPIEPFGEYLTFSCSESSISKIYDEIQLDPTGSVWDPRCDPPLGPLQALTLPPKSGRSPQVQSEALHHPQRVPSSASSSSPLETMGNTVPPVPRRLPKTTVDPGTSRSKVVYAELEHRVPRPQTSGARPRPGGPGPIASQIPCTVYSELNPQDRRSESLPVLDDGTREGQSHRLSAPARLSPNPPHSVPGQMLSLQEQGERLRGSVGPPGSAHSHTPGILTRHRLYHEVGQDFTNAGVGTERGATPAWEDTYAEVPCMPAPTRSRLAVENTYNRIPKYRLHVASSPEAQWVEGARGAQGGQHVEGNAYEMLTDLRAKRADPSWGNKNETWRQLYPDRWRK